MATEQNTSGKPNFGYFSTKAKYDGRTTKVDASAICFVADEHSIYNRNVRFSGYDSSGNDVRSTYIKNITSPNLDYIYLVRGDDSSIKVNLNLGNLAGKDTAQGSTSYKPAGTITAPPVTINKGTTNVINSINFSQGSLPTLGTAIPADDITAWSAGTKPSLTKTDYTTTHIDSFSGGSAASFDVSNGVLTLNGGSAASMTKTDYTNTHIDNWSAGSVPSLSYTAKSIPNVTAIGSLPTLDSSTIAVMNDASATATAPTFDGSTATITITVS